MPAPDRVCADNDEVAYSWCVVPNLTRGIVLTGLDQLWGADITYVHLADEFGYLAVILDAFSRKVVGWAPQAHLHAELAISALMMAITARQPIPGALIHHSDRSVQYACTEYTEILAAYDIQPSMSRVGNPYDNVRAESFMKTLRAGRDQQLSQLVPSPKRRRSLCRTRVQPPAAPFGSGLSLA